MKLPFAATAGLLIAVAVMLQQPVQAQSGCAEIVSVSASISQVSSATPYTCTVTVAGSSAGNRNIACGVSLNGGFPLDYCPSDEFFGGWSGANANFNCVFPNTNISSEITKVELVGYDFSPGCGPEQGKRLEVQLVRPPASTSGGVSGTPASPVVEVTTAPTNQEAEARSLLRNLLTFIFSGTNTPDSPNSQDPSSPGTDTTGGTGSSTGGNTSGGQPQRPPTTANLANAESYSDQVLNDIIRVCNADGIPGRVSRYNVSCLNATSFSPNARQTAVDNTNAYQYLQCFGLTQSLWAALNGDLSSGSNPFLGHLWPTNLITNPSSGIQARFQQYSMSECKQVARANEHLILIWGTPGVFPGNQHIASGVFVSNQKDNLKTWEGNTDWAGTAKIKNRPSTGAYAPAYCLIQKN